MKLALAFALLAVAVACSSSTPPPPASPSTTPATAPAVVLNAPRVIYERRHLAAGGTIELPVSLSEKGGSDVNAETFETRGMTVTVSTEGRCGRDVPTICEMYGGCQFGRDERGSRHVRRVKLGKTEAVYELDVTYDASHANAGVVGHVLDSWELPGEDLGWFCHGS